MRTFVKTVGGVAPPNTVLGELALGDRAGPWIIDWELGRGGMGVVYAVTHEAIGKRAALKVVHAHLVTPRGSADRMLVEARAVNQIGHPNIVDIFDTGKLPDGRPYIVMERLDGESLDACAARQHIPPDDVIAILLQVCDALRAAHEAGVIHRDLKPDNILLLDHSPRIKVLDWGIAKVINTDARATHAGEVVGTPLYASPEQVHGDEVTPQSDVYSLGVMAYELFLEHPPFEADTSAEIMTMHLRATPPPPAALWPDIPPALAQLLLAMLAKSPHHRPTMSEIARVLGAVRVELARPPSPAPVIPRSTVLVTPLPPPSTSRVRRRWQPIVGAAALVAIAVLVGISRASDHEEPSRAAPQRTRIVTPSPRPVASSILLLAPAPVAPANIEPARASEPTRPVPRRTSITRPAATRHRAPVVPRRDSRPHPDGILDPYP